MATGSGSAWSEFDALTDEALDREGYDLTARRARRVHDGDV
jgi:hypothetical protein